MSSTLTKYYFCHTVFHVMSSVQKIFRTSFFLFAFAQIFHLARINFPEKYSYDEVHYVNASKEYLNGHLYANWEHPPLGKFLIASGISLFGDRPLGWRFMSTLFGSLTLVGVYLLGWLLFQDQMVALWIYCLTLFNQINYVQSRIAMLDGFMMSFIVWGLLGFFESMNFERSPTYRKIALLFSSCMFGCAISSKWFGLFAWLGSLGLIFLSYWKNKKKPPVLENGKFFLISFFLVPFLVYFAHYIPLFLKVLKNQDLFSIYKTIFSFQKEMYLGQINIDKPHPYMSWWWEWPFLNRPIWYTFDGELDNAFVRGVICLGNPWIMWTGVPAIVFCLWDFLQRKSSLAFVIVYFYSVFLGAWIVIPRKVLFYYYYYPSAMVLSFALAHFFHSPLLLKICNKCRIQASSLSWMYLGISLGFFIYFMPILAAFKIPVQSYNIWMWFQRWI